MNEQRRICLKAAVAAALAPLFPLVTSGVAHGAPPSEQSPVQVIVPKDYRPPTDRDYAHRLGRAVLDFLHDHYHGQHLPVWGRLLEDIDLEKRVVNIVYWVLKAVREHQKIYPVDPAWVMAQIMAESFFYEFAVSPALAVGICQFVPVTARSYDMLVAGDEEEHAKPPFKKSEFAGMYEEYRRLRQERRNLLRKNSRFRNEKLLLREALEALVANGSYGNAAAHLEYLEAREEMEKKITQARQHYRDYLKANFEGRSIFSSPDLRFLVAFDERVTYRKPVLSMVHMLAKGLVARNGNILASAAAYNAGLSSTVASGLYEPFGRLPVYEETVTYISRLVVNHHAIVRRL